jgi:K+-transporting ATPase ATPase B chain
MKNKNAHSLWNRKLILQSFLQSFEKLAPNYLIKNPVMFMTATGAFISLICTLQDFSSFNVQITCWLWFTVIFANFSEALAEGRGKAQAESLRNRNSNLKSKIYNLQTRQETDIDAKDLNRGDVVICKAGDLIPMDGEVIQGVASVDESAITGESAPVIRESGGDRSAVTGGTQVKSDWIIIRITSERGKTFVDKMIHLIEGAKRQKTPNEIALSLVLTGLSIILICVVLSLKYFFDYAANESGLKLSLSLPVLISLLVCLIPTTIAGLLSAIGISGMNRLIKNNVVAKSGRSVEAAGDISVLLLDKTGTITHGNRKAHELYPLEGVTRDELAQSALLASYSDETAEGRSIVELATKILGNNILDVKKLKLNFIPFTAETRMSGVDIHDDSGELRAIRKGAVDSVLSQSKNQKSILPSGVQQLNQEILKKVVLRF